MLFLFFGELHEDLLAFRVFEALAVFLEEAMRAPLAANANQQRLLIVHALVEPVCAFGEQPVCGALEEEERGPGLELGVRLQQLRIARFERAEVFLLFFGQLLKNGAAPCVLRDARRARIEVEPAALGGNRDTKGIAGENHLRGAALRFGRACPV